MLGGASKVLRLVFRSEPALSSNGDVYRRARNPCCCLLTRAYFRYLQLGQLVRLAVRVSQGTRGLVTHLGIAGSSTRYVCGLTHQRLSLVACSVADSALPGPRGRKTMDSIYDFAFEARHVGTECKGPRVC